jgi:hypothetical protein
MPLTKHRSGITILTEDLSNSWFGGLYGTTEGNALDSADPLVAGHIHDGQHIDGHAQKVSLADHVTGQLDGASLQLLLDNACTYAFDVLVIGRQTGGAAGTAGDSFYEETKLAIEMTGGVPTGVAGGTSNTISTSAGAAAWVVAATIDAGTDAMIINVTGEVDKNINWVATARIVKVAG